MAQKRKAVDKLSIEDAIARAEEKLESLYVPKSGLPLELQLTIWSPLVREMNVLDLMDLAWTPSWGLDGVRFLLSDDDLWMFFWDRDFLKTDICKDIPLRIPEFLTQDDARRDGRDLSLDEGDKIFLKMPWRRYYLWTHFALRTLSKIVAFRINKDVIDFRNVEYMKRNAVENMPFGVDLKYTVLQIKDKTVASLTRQEMGGPKFTSMGMAEDYPVTVKDVIQGFFSSALSNPLPKEAVWVGSMTFWESEREWSLPVYAARFIISTGIQNLRGLDGGIPALNIDLLDTSFRKYILSWLIWCLMESDGQDYDEVGGDGPELQGRTKRDVLRWMAQHLSEVAGRAFPMPSVLPIVPRTRMDSRDGNKRKMRSLLYLGKEMSNICFNCSESQGLKQCKDCKKALYCSKECQVEHWSLGHKEECRK